MTGKGIRQTTVIAVMIIFSLVCFLKSIGVME